MIYDFLIKIYEEERAQNHGSALWLNKEKGFEICLFLVVSILKHKKMTKEKKKGIATVFTRQLGSGLSGRPVGNFENQFLFENRKKEKERKCNLAGYDVYTLQLQIYLFINLKILNNSTTNTRLIWYSSIQTLPLAHLNSVSIVTLQSSLLLDLSNTHFSLSLSLSLIYIPCLTSKPFSSSET